MILLTLYYSVVLARLNALFEIRNRINRTVSFCYLWLSILMAVFLIVLTALPLIRAVDTMGAEDISSYALFILLSVVYSLCVAYSIGDEKEGRYLPLSVFATLVTVIVLVGPMKTGLIKNMGIGGYQTNLSVENKYLIGLPSAINIESEERKYDASIFKSVWVAASLSDKIVLSASEDLKTTFSIPSKAILSEW